MVQIVIGTGEMNLVSLVKRVQKTVTIDPGVPDGTSGFFYWAMTAGEAPRRETFEPWMATGLIEPGRRFVPFRPANC